MVGITEFLKGFRADMCIFLHKNIRASLPSAVRVLLKDYFWLLLNIAIVQLIIKNLCHNDILGSFLY